jgi:hypothetical protein
MIRPVAPRLLLPVVLATLALAPLASAGPARTGGVSPLCSLYGVTLTTELLTQDFDSPKLTVNAKKWPLLMTQAKNARTAFGHPPLLAVRDRYDSLVRRLGVVGERLLAGDRKAAYAELESARPDLAAVVGVARRAHLACRSGANVFYIR